MIYKQNVLIPSTEEIVEHYVAKCIKCGNDDIHIYEYADKYGFISSAQCKNKQCDNKVKINACKIAAIKEWNNQNDILTLIENKKLLIIKTKNEIIKLSQLLKNTK